jgi:hypothetical protein
MKAYNGMRHNVNFLFVLSPNCTFAVLPRVRLEYYQPFHFNSLYNNLLLRGTHVPKFYEAAMNSLPLKYQFAGFEWKNFVEARFLKQSLQADIFRPVMQGLQCETQKVHHKVFLRNFIGLERTPRLTFTACTIREPWLLAVPNVLMEWCVEPYFKQIIVCYSKDSLDGDVVCVIDSEDVFHYKTSVAVLVYRPFLEMVTSDQFPAVCRAVGLLTQHCILCRGFLGNFSNNDGFHAHCVVTSGS